MSMHESDIMRDLEATGALLSGHFELRSKLHSDRFFQCALLQRQPRVFERLCAALAEELRRAQLGRLDAVIAPAIGGIVVGHELACDLDLLSIFAEKENGRLAMRRFQIDRGARYVVAEDVVTRGGRVQETIDLVRAAGAEVAAVAVLIDRSGGAADFGVPLFSLLRMTPRVWQPADCPLCRQGLSLVHPGS
jgi:orotate phosphoribosyltransferase